MRYFLVAVTALFLASCSTGKILVVKKTCQDHPQLSELASCEPFNK